MKNYLNLLGKKSRKAFSQKIATKKKNKVLLDFAGEIKKRKKLILIKNVKDIKNAKKKNLRENLINRLLLNSEKINQIIKSIRTVAKLKDPENVILEKWKRPNGLKISKVTVPIGVIGIIY